MGSPEILFQFGLSSWGFLLLVVAMLGLSAYIRIATVLGIVRVGLGWSSAPGAFVVGSLALSLSFFVMTPTLREAATAAQQVIRPGERVVDESLRGKAFAASAEVWRKYLVAQSSEAALNSFSAAAQRLNEKGGHTAGVAEDTSLRDSWQVAAPAFVLTQLQVAFSVGLRLFLPLLLIDLLVASVLMALSAEQLSPQLIAFPLKILLFLVVDGWTLITANLISAP